MAPTVNDACSFAVFRAPASWLDMSASPWLIVDQLAGSHHVGVPGTTAGIAFGYPSETIVAFGLANAEMLLSRLTWLLR
ncbi:MAG TPA: hypothetical protein VF892_00910, partial [Pseudonocardiaceae bacterium]